MKIAILNTGLFPIPAVKGGAVETLIESFIKFGNNNTSIDITVFSIADSNATKKSLLYPNIHFKWLNRPAFINQLDKMLTACIRFIKRDSDIWQLNYIWKWYNSRLVKRHLLKADFDVVLIENAMYLCRLFQSKKLQQKYYKKVFFHTHNTHFKKAQATNTLAGIISISQFLKQNTIECFSKDVPVHVVYNGVNTDDFTNDIPISKKYELKSNYTIPQNVPVLLFVGRLLPKKGIHVLIDAFQQIKNQSAHLLIVGTSSFGMEELSPFERTIKQLINNHPHIHEAGFIPNDEIAQYYQMADLVVLPSIWDEPFGLTMVEAQLSGTPLITTKKGGIVESTSATNSYLLDVDEQLVTNLALAIDDVLDHYNEWYIKAQQAKKIAHVRFDEHTFYKHMLAVLNITQS